MSNEHPSAELMRDWFNRGQSGCKFASHLASGDPRLAFVVHLDVVTSLAIDDIDSQIDAVTAKGDVCLLVFPRATSELEIADLAAHLELGARWRVNARPCPNNSSVRGLGIEFETNGGEWSSAMGFAPCGNMPVTRRAPYIALALWGGGHANEFFNRSPPGTVNMADVATGLNEESYQKAWKASQTSSRRRLEDPAYDSVWLRGVAFCLARAATDSRWPA